VVVVKLKIGFEFAWMTPLCHAPPPRSSGKLKEQEAFARAVLVSETLTNGDWREDARGSCMRGRFVAFSIVIVRGIAASSFSSFEANFEEGFDFGRI
jgi:hypothetical protein